jgi:very-short-patch-repair endonuclease
MGLRVVRFRNEEVVKNLSAVVGNVRELVTGGTENRVSLGQEIYL